MKLRTKILGGFIVMALLTVTLGITGLYSTMRLDRISSELHSLQLENDSVSRVLNAHYVWRQGLTESVLTGSEFKGSLDPRTCTLGKWYDSDEARNMSDPELLSMLQGLNDPHDFMHREAGNVVALTQAGEYEAAKEYLEDVIFPKTAAVISVLTSMQARYNDIVTEKEHESNLLAGLMYTVNVALIVIALVVCVVLSLYISGTISKPLVVLAAFMKKAGSTGDITLTPADVETISKYSRVKDEIGQTIDGASAFIKHVTTIAGELSHIANGDLAIDTSLLSDKDTMGKSVKQVVENLNNMIVEISASTTNLSSSAEQVSDGAQTLALGASEQTAAIKQLSDSIAEISEKTRENAGTAEETSKLSGAIIQDAEKGSQKMDEMIVAVGEINEASKNISKIMKTIDDIAFQTNILALNAAVEAARAGEHGKGFAVVAEEVRNLASKSAEAAKDTGQMIQNSMEKAELGSSIVEETAGSLKEIVSGITEANRLVTEIARSSEEQTHGISSINTGIERVAQVIQQNNTTAEHSAAASEEMSGQSLLLEELIAQFKLRDEGAIKRELPMSATATRRARVLGRENSLALQSVNQ